MQYSLIRSITLAASLIFAPVAIHSVIAADQTPMSVPGMEKININEATSEMLSMIKGIGTKKAQSIIDYRDSIGKFESLDELLNVKGIGQATLDKIKPYLTL